MRRMPLWVLRGGMDSGLLAYVGIFALAQHWLLAAPAAWIAAFCALLLFIGFVGEESGWGDIGGVPVGYFALLLMVVGAAAFTIAETSWLAVAASIGAVILMAILRGAKETALKRIEKQRREAPAGPGANRSEDA
ncbi:MAG TPA: hypothetical protein VGE07_07850 [Herpetosiphonaceae bacterium]